MAYNIIVRSGYELNSGVKTWYQSLVLGLLRRLTFGCIVCAHVIWCVMV